jgi:hypothetical protein
VPEAAADAGLRREDRKQERLMETFWKGLKLWAGAALLAVLIYLILSVPGFVSDRDSTVPVATPMVTVR